MKDLVEKNWICLMTRISVVASDLCGWGAEDAVGKTQRWIANEIVVMLGEYIKKI